MAAALDIRHPTEISVEALAEWGRKRGVDWSRPGRIWEAGPNHAGVTVYFCGVVGDPAIVERALLHIIQLAGASPYSWEMIRLIQRARGVCSWEDFMDACPLLLRSFREV
ncbi:hypothetical protein [Melghirimyces profundicolus]|uniref:hypothetical protein n=1 Tax=Melghirimyces profundicolus TaxID=1242148 RepID=UPI000D36922E|nr:hypothetical protein [Melghirimyces profundicolus]